MLFNRIILKIIACCCLYACGVAPSSSSQAVRDEQRVLGMVLVERDGVQRLQMLVCALKANQGLVSEPLVNISTCRNAFVDGDGNPYYFAELQPRGLKKRFFTNGYLKLGSLLLIPVVVGTGIGWKIKPLLQKLKLIVNRDGKLHRDRGLRNNPATAAAKRQQEEVLADVRANTKVGFAGGTIVSLVIQHRLSAYLWGHGERLTHSHWDNIFRVQQSFDDAVMLNSDKDIDHILTTIATALALHINPALETHSKQRATTSG